MAIRKKTERPEWPQRPLAASVLMSMGMMMLPPVVVSLPFKLIFFVLVDSLVAGSLVQSYEG
jgi:flagellar biosynthetic protein FliP